MILIRRVTFGSLTLLFWTIVAQDSPYTPPPYGSHRWLAEEGWPYTSSTYGSHRWLAEKDPASPGPTAGSRKMTRQALTLLPPTD
ncbi:Hypothetical protein NocV09_00301530, partial [Nannochloropsis oceanica]